MYGSSYIFYWVLHEVHSQSVINFVCSNDSFVRVIASAEREREKSGCLYPSCYDTYATAAVL